MTRMVAEMALQLLTRSVDDVAGHENRIASALVNALRTDPVATRHGSIDVPVPDLRVPDHTTSDGRMMAMQGAMAAFTEMTAPSGATLH